MHTWVRWTLVMAYAGGIFYLSSQPQLPTPPGGDKTAHVVVYAGLGFVVAWALGARWRGAARLLAAAAWAALYGVSDEWHQSFVPGRDASAGDIIADAAGAVIGATVFVGLKWIAIRLYAEHCAPSGAVSNSVLNAAARPPEETS